MWQVPGGNLMENGTQGIVLGYATKSKGYMIYYLTYHKILINRDWIFDKGSYWDWNSEKECKIGPVAEPQITDDVTTFDIEVTTDTQVFKSKTLSEVYEECKYNVEPTSYSETIMSQEWFPAIKTELDAIEKNNTLVLIDLPWDKKAIGVKWVFKTKRNLDGLVFNYKVRLVVTSFS